MGSVDLEKFSDQSVAQSEIPPGKGTFVDEIISLEYCKKDILGHMKQLQLSQSEITTEAEFILCRAGKTFFLFISDVMFISYKCPQ